MATRVYVPGMRLGHATLVTPVTTGFPGALRNVPARWWVRCDGCRRVRKAFVCALAMAVRAGREPLCIACSGKARRKPRKCGSCGTADPKRMRGKATECERCERRRQRNGTCPACPRALRGGTNGSRAPICECGWRGLSNGDRAVVRASDALHASHVAPTAQLLALISGVSHIARAVKRLGIPVCPTLRPRKTPRPKRLLARERAWLAFDALEAAHVMPDAELVAETGRVSLSSAASVVRLRLRERLVVYTKGARKPMRGRRSPRRPHLLMDGAIRARRYPRADVASWFERHRGLAPRWLAGEDLRALAAEAGVNHNTLRSAFSCMGIRKTPRSVVGPAG